jgi:peptidoglycan/xylan/chitin deacetylase (PgdA/CDA1 family)
MSLIAINHHYYRNNSTGQGIYPLSAKELARRVSFIGKYWSFATEDDVISFCGDELSDDKNVCVLTFDDGLKEQIKAVHDLNSLGIKAICFVSTAPIIDGVMLDVHKLHMIRSEQSDEEIAKDLHRKFNMFDYSFDDELLTIQYRYDTLISRKVKYYLNFVMDKDIRDDWVSDVFNKKFGSEKNACEKLYMNADDIRFLAKNQVLGTHSHHHFPLATLSNSDTEKEIRNSIDILEDISKNRVRGISYPYGGKSAVSEDLYSIAQNCGLEYGFTMERGINKSCGNDSLSLKRIDTNDYIEWCGRG